MAADEPQWSLGHEIRSHLTVIKGYTQFVIRLLRRPDVPRDEILTHAEALEAHVLRLEASADELLGDRDSDDATTVAGDKQTGDPD